MERFLILFSSHIKFLTFDSVNHFHRTITILLHIIIMVDHKIYSNHIGMSRSHLPIFSLGIRHLYV
jgi:hypothetical protein